MANLEKAIRGLECCGGISNAYKCPYQGSEGCDNCRGNIYLDALSLLKAQELPDVKPEKLEERTTKWLDQMTAEERLEEIAAILDDWDGYRTAKGLGWLINEVWAYALYPVKAQEPRVMTLEEVKAILYDADIWIETEYYVGKITIFAATINTKGLRGVMVYGSHKTYDYEAYNKLWRCWTSRPSDSERENTPWEK